ncbi:MAG: glutamine synthetase, partial [Moraxellaceae bacterium]|nr:glutamine synthetase [Moraxellaceae bacterium]
DKDLYDLPPEEDALVPTVAENLETALAALKADHEFLLKGGVFTKEMLDAYIELKTEEARLVSTSVHPVEFELYYSC